jgi:adenine-specific DNA-methyltransferase
MKTERHQKLPASGAGREALRTKGQFWTPEWVARAMVAYALRENPTDHLFDPAVGAGAFFRAARDVTAPAGRRVHLLGNEIDPAALDEATASGLPRDCLRDVELRDFVLNPPSRSFDAIIGNPPYIRHHRLTPEAKDALRAFGQTLLGKPLDGRAGLHVHFLLRALERLNPNGRLAFLLPADVCEGKFSGPLWQWITGRFRLDAVVTFDREAPPFPGVDTNALIFFVRNAPSAPAFLWACVRAAGTPELERWAGAELSAVGNDAIEVVERSLSEGLATGLSRPPRVGDATGGYDGPVLGDFATVQRGIATGANEFFFFTRQQARDLCLPADFLLPAVGRTRDVQTDS